MKGCIKNVSPGWAHAFKRAVGPGEEISLDELYEQYGQKHNIGEGDEFIHWLRNVKLRDTSRWKIIYEGTNKESDSGEDTTTAVTEEPVVKVKNEEVRIVPKDMAIKDIVGLSVRRAREVLPRISDLRLLKYALNEAGPRAGKDSLCRLVRKRIRELETISR